MVKKTEELRGRNEFDFQYQLALKQIMEGGVEEVNKRTGHKTKILPGAYFAIEAGFPLLSLRKIPVRIFVASSTEDESHFDIPTWIPFARRNGKANAPPINI